MQNTTHTHLICNNYIRFKGSSATSVKYLIIQDDISTTTKLRVNSLQSVTLLYTVSRKKGSINQSINDVNGCRHECLYIRISTLQRDLRQSKLDLAYKLRSISDSDKISCIVKNNFLIGPKSIQSIFKYINRVYINDKIRQTVPGIYYLAP